MNERITDSYYINKYT